MRCTFCQLFILLFLPLSLWIRSCDLTGKSKSKPFFFPVVLFLVLYKMGLTFEPVDEPQRQKVKHYRVAIHLKAT